MSGTSAPVSMARRTRAQRCVEFNFVLARRSHYPGETIGVVNCGGDWFKSCGPTRCDDGVTACHHCDEGYWVDPGYWRHETPQGDEGKCIKCDHNTLKSHDVQCKCVLEGQKCGSLSCAANHNESRRRRNPTVFAGRIAAAPRGATWIFRGEQNARTKIDGRRRSSGRELTGWCGPTVFVGWIAAPPRGRA